MTTTKKYLKILILAILAILSIFFIIFVYSPYVRLHSLIALHSLQSRLNLNSIEKVYIINLDNCAQRYENTLKNLETLKLPSSHIRLSAINGSKIQFIQNNVSIPISTVFPNKIPSLNGIFRLNYKGSLQDSAILLHGKTKGIRFPGELGCYCSHREVWNDILTKGYKKVLILEDDAIFSSQSPSILDLALKNIPEDYDILFLGIMALPDALDPSTKYLCFQKVIKHIANLHAYIITDKAAKILLENTKLFIKPIDLKVNELIENKIITAYSTYPLIAHQSGPSITSSGKLD